MTEVTLDWDVDYSGFVQMLDAKDWVSRSESNLRRLLSKWQLGPNRLSFRFRRSSSHHVHVTIRSDCGMTPVEQFCLRSLLMDDRTRLILDLARYAMRGPVNRLWDAKYSNGRIGNAGPWHHWFTVRIGRVRSRNLKDW